MTRNKKNMKKKIAHLAKLQNTLEKEKKLLRKTSMMVNAMELVQKLENIV